MANLILAMVIQSIVSDREQGHLISSFSIDKMETFLGKEEANNIGNSNSLNPMFF